MMPTPHSHCPPTAVARTAQPLRAWLRRCVLLLTGLACISPGAMAQQPPQGMSEYTLKAALLFKLPRFTYFPGRDAQAPLALCVLGKNPFGNALEKLAQATIQNGPAVTLHNLTAANQAQDCQVVFVARSEAGQLAAHLQALSAQPLLTVSDIDGFARQGGMVELVLENQSKPALAIWINRAAAQQQDIKFNAQLLRLAKLWEP